jgi:hypothetical protein
MIYVLACSNNLFDVRVSLAVVTLMARRTKRQNLGAGPPSVGSSAIEFADDAMPDAIQMTWRPLRTNANVPRLKS